MEWDLGSHLYQGLPDIDAINDCCSFISGKRSNQLGRVQPLNIWSWLLAVEELPQLVTDVVVQQLRPHHRHEHGAHHDGHPHLVGDHHDRDVTSM